MFNAILWIIKTGAPLEVWDDILRMLSINADPEAIIIDATFIKLHQHGTGAKGGTPIRRSGAVKAD
ncbi:hypothetical protein [Desulfovibrio fairfieldensis]|uniref:Transposase n=1 Tax=Desulfovibrio fairfieldensis TaxID=44742 RepID=A0A0X8JJQ8_9BACT|nr:hypothetical protein [Desulfovibrio fairfieldensis]AMD90037.1 hypothetical protein AXF13_07850 [Desulfovibrio fairfieldensis]